jgi:hypothetical protein
MATGAGARAAGRAGATPTDVPPLADAGTTWPDADEGLAAPDEGADTRADPGVIAFKSASE